MRSVLSVIAVMLLVGIVQAMPVVGTFDSRTDGSTIVANVPYVTGAPVSSFWEDATESIGQFFAWGYSGETQWYIEAHDPTWEDGYCGFINLNSFGDAPWFGDDPEAIGGYEGLITEWTLDKTYTGEALDLVLRGTAVLDKYHMMPWYAFVFEDMSPALVSFEMGFSGVPDEGYIGGTPSYMVVSIVPEPATLAILGLGGLLLIRRRIA